MERDSLKKVVKHLVRLFGVIPALDHRDLQILSSSLVEKHLVSLDKFSSQRMT